MKTTPIAGVIALSFLLAGCSAPDVVGDDSVDDVAVEQPVEQAPDSDTVSPEQPPSDQPPPLALSSCAPGTQDALDATIDGQIRAFGRGDFDAAYAYASPGFQVGMPVEVFGPLIQASFPELLEVTGFRSLQCEVDEDNGISTIVVRFDTPGNPDYTLRYILERVDGNWLIAGANPETVTETIA
jgi:hypothetical protein